MRTLWEIAESEHPKPLIMAAVPGISLESFCIVPHTELRATDHPNTEDCGTRSLGN